MNSIFFHNKIPLTSMYLPYFRSFFSLFFFFFFVIVVVFIKFILLSLSQTTDLLTAMKLRKSFYLCFVLIGLLINYGSGAQKIISLANYHDYEAMTSSLEMLHDIYPEMTHVYSIGKSVDGKLCSFISHYIVLVPSTHIVTHADIYS